MRNGGKRGEMCTNRAGMLTEAGYAATMRQHGGGGSASGKVVAAKREERMRRLRWVLAGAAAAWLCLGLINRVQTLVR